MFPEGPTANSYDLIAEFYDDDMGANVSGRDVAFYTRACREADGPVLELGCGTGRVTLPLVRAGVRTVGIDVSMPMLRVMQRKSHALDQAARARLAFCRMDMRALAFGGRFATILCPYSGFTYVVEDAEQSAVLERVHALLRSDGELLLDVFIPDAAVDDTPPDHVFFDYRRELPNGTTLERTKTIARDPKRRINCKTRYYRVLDAGGHELRRVVTRDRIRYWQPDELAERLRRHGFDVVDISPELGPRAAGEPAMAVLRGRPITPRRARATGAQRR